MKETLEAEKARLIDVIKHYDEQHKEAAKMANIFRRQLKQIERAIETYKTTQAPGDESDNDEMILKK